MKKISTWGFMATLAFCQSCDSKPSKTTDKHESSKPLEVRSIPVEQPPTLLSAKEETPTHITEVKLEQGATINGAFVEAGLDGPSIRNYIEAVKAHLNPSRLPAGSLFTFEWTNPEQDLLLNISYEISTTESVEAVAVPFQDSYKFKANLNILPVSVETVAFQGVVQQSLWASASASGMDASLIGRIADIFAWQVDFSRDVHPGDQWRLTVEKHVANGRFVSWGKILAASWKSRAEEINAVRFQHPQARGLWFTPDGQSLRRLFLKSPVKYSRITSKFQRRRFHPILKVNRPHNGVDYAARPGTPVMTVGDGRVTFRGRRGGSGNVIKIRHNSIYETSYHHLKGFAKGLKRGQKVTQGQVIGYVGSTGLATGPHLHFAFHEKGRFVDPQGIKFPSADPVPSSLMPVFQEKSLSNLQLLPRWPTEVTMKEGKNKNSG